MHQLKTNLPYMENSTPGSQPIVVPSQVTPPASLAKASELFKQAWRVYKKHVGFFVRMYIVGILFSLAVAIPGILFLMFAIGKQNLALGIIGGVLILPVIYISLWWWVAFIRVVGKIVDGQSAPSVRSAFDKDSRKLIPVFFGVSILTGLAMLLGTILFIIPGIIFAIWFSFSSYVAVFENRSATDSMKKSRFYAKGKFWAILWRWLFAGLVYLALYIVLMIIVEVLPENAGVVVNAIGEMAFSLFWSPFFIVYGYTLYQAVKKNSETNSQASV